jgi:hypothetical protein
MSGIDGGGGMTAQLPGGLRRLAELQCGEVSRRQALDTGLSADTIPSRVRGGRLPSDAPGQGLDDLELRRRLFGGPFSAARSAWCAVRSIVRRPHG